MLMRRCLYDYRGIIDRAEYLPTHGHSVEEAEAKVMYRQNEGMQVLGQAAVAGR